MNEEENKEILDKEESDSSDELSQIPVNKSMMKADEDAMKEQAAKKKRNRKKKNKKGHNQDNTGEPRRGRSNTAEEIASELPQSEEQKELFTIKESYRKEIKDDKAPEYQNTKDSTDNSSEIEKSKHLFVSKTEEDDWQLTGFPNRGQTLNAKMKNHFDAISENESES